MSFRVIQWATGGVGRAAMEGVLAHPDLELAGAWVHSPAKDGVDLGDLLGREPSASPRPATSTRCWRPRPTASSTARSSPIPAVVAAILESGKNVVTPLGWFYPPTEERSEFDGDRPDRRRDAARHRDPSRGHHRAVPAHGLGPLGLHHPRAGRGVLRHPHLRRPRRGPRLDALRQDPRGGTRQHHGRRARRRVPPVDLHGGRRAGLRHRSPAAHHPRDGGRHRADRLAHRARSSRGPWPRNGSRGRPWSTASRWSPPRSTG